MSIFKKTDNPAVALLVKKVKKRTTTMDRLRPRKDLDGNKICVWCSEKLKGAQRKWCSAGCSSSAWGHNNPQGPEGLHIILSMQEYKCKVCRFDYMPDILKIQENFKRRNSYTYQLDTPNHWLFKRLKDTHCDSVTRPEVDHIIPIALGGDSIGFGNHQVLCRLCHKHKTKQDISAIAKSKREKK